MKVSSAEVPRIINDVYVKHGMTHGGGYTNQHAWNEIFHRVFGCVPTGNDDPRWDTLFSTHGGLEALHAIPNES
jgi:hypothetical protein